MIINVLSDYNLFSIFHFVSTCGLGDIELTFTENCKTCQRQMLQLILTNCYCIQRFYFVS
jgi:hypothetical protein